LSGDKREEDQILLMFMLAQQGFNYRVISEKLASEGYKKTAETTISNRLRNPRYAGILHNKNSGEIIPGRFPAVIDKKLFFEVQSILKDKKKQSKARNKTQNNEALPLRKILLCNGCGNHITGSLVTYRCNKCKISIKNNELHTKLVKFIADFDYTIDVADTLVEDIFSFLAMLSEKTEINKEKYENYIMQVENEITLVNKNYLHAERLDEEALGKELDRLGKKKVELEKRVKLLQSIPGLIANLAEDSIPDATISETWPTVSTDSKRELIRYIFPDGLYYDGEDFHYDKVGNHFQILEGNKTPTLRIVNNKINMFCSFVKKLYPLQLVNEEELAIINELYQELSLN